MQVYAFGLHPENGEPSVTFETGDRHPLGPEYRWRVLTAEQTGREPLVVLYDGTHPIQRWRHHTSGLLVQWLRDAADLGRYHVASRRGTTWYTVEVEHDEAAAMVEAADVLEATLSK